MDTSELLPVSFKPSLEASSFNPLNMGIVVLFEIANWISLIFFNNSKRLTENFIRSALLLN